MIGIDIVNGNDSILEPILKVSTAQLEDDTLFDVILYSMGAIKNISTNEINQVELNKLHAVHIISNWINKENIQVCSNYSFTYTTVIRD